MAEVLIVEDDAAILEMLVLMVERLGHTVRAVATAEAALMSSAESRPDLMLLDLSLPGRNGDELVAMLQRGFGRPRSLVIVSAQSHDEVHAVARRFGTLHLHKPFLRRDLDEIIAVALDSIEPEVEESRGWADDWADDDSDDDANDEAAEHRQ